MPITEFYFFVAPNFNLLNLQNSMKCEIITAKIHKINHLVFSLVLIWSSLLKEFHIGWIENVYVVVDYHHSYVTVCL